MIVASLLLILVAVTLLVLGLASGSSLMLTSSIVASLLAAVALVIGARQAAGRRVATAAGSPSPLAVDLDDDPGPATMPSGRDARFAPADTSGAHAAAAARMGMVPPPFPAGHAADDPGPVRYDPVTGDPVLGDPVVDGTADTEAFARVRAADSDDPTAPHDRPGDTGDADRLAADPPPARGAGPDTVETPHAADSASGASTLDGVHPEAAAHPAHDMPADDVRPDDLPADDLPADDLPADDLRPDDVRADEDLPAGARTADGGPAGDDAPAADDEDPADEPPPQRTAPTDAVRVARMVAEVLVVDGRPRYHLGDCASLGGRITEPLPVAEAVELGFTPCSMCRPVDRLVAEAVPR